MFLLYLIIFFVFYYWVYPKLQATVGPALRPYALWLAFFRENDPSVIFAKKSREEKKNSTCEPISSIPPGPVVSIKLEGEKCIVTFTEGKVAALSQKDTVYVLLRQGQPIPRELVQHVECGQMFMIDNVLLKQTTEQ